MNYVISDIHGCYEQYMKLLDKIHFSERDTLYLLGDLVDRGPEPMEVVKDVMRRKNVVTIMGNHDYRALRILERFDPHGTIINSEDLLTCKYWIKDGGKSTVQGFLNMSLHERSEFLDYFGLNSIDDLPDMRDFITQDENEDEVDLYHSKYKEQN